MWSLNCPADGQDVEGMTDGRSCCSLRIAGQLQEGRNRFHHVVKGLDGAVVGAIVSLVHQTLDLVAYALIRGHIKIKMIHSPQCHGQ